VIAQDDAAHVAWIPIQNLPLFSKLMHDDHYYILKQIKILFKAEKKPVSGLLFVLFPPE